MSGLLNFLKELFLIKQEDKKIVGLTSLKKSQNETVKKAVKKKKEEKELKLSDLMRRHKPQNAQNMTAVNGNSSQPQQRKGSIRPANPVYSQKSFK